jgi:hypothetical protein
MRTFVVVLLLSGWAFGNACTSAGTGNWASITWNTCGGGVPGNGDTATISNGNTVTIPAATSVTVGTDSGTAIQSSGTGILIVRGTLTYKGNVVRSNANWIVDAGAVLHHSSAAGHYKWSPSSGTFLLTISGSSGSHVTWDNTGASGYAGQFEGEIAASYVDTANIGSGDNYSFRAPTDTAGTSFSLDHVISDVGGAIYLRDITSTSSVSITNSVIKNTFLTTYGMLDMHAWGAKVSGTRQIKNNYLDGGMFITSSSTDGLDVGLVFQDNLCYTSGTVNTYPPCYYSADGSRVSFSGTNWARNAAWANITSGTSYTIALLPSGTLNDAVFLNSNPTLCPSNTVGMNYNVTFPGNGLNTTFNGGYDEPDCGQLDPTGDLFIIHKGATVATYAVNNWIHAGGQDGTSTSLFTYVGGGSAPDCIVGSTCPVVTINQSTLNVANNSTQSVCPMGAENAPPNTAGLYTETNGILFAETSHNDALTCWLPGFTAPSGTWSANYNAKWNLLQDPYTGTGSSGKVSPAGTNDQTGNPVFARSPASNKFLNWCQSLDGTITTWQGCRAKFASQTSGFTVSAMLAWIRAGFQPSATFVKTMSSSGSYVGAVAPSTLAPVLLFSDLDAGPKTGGENNKGVYVCVWGRNFGSSRGTSTITVGGGLVDNYPVWNDSTGLPLAPSKACFQLGALAVTGSIAMTTPGGTATLPGTFTVRSGSIYFLDPANNSGAASDASAGTAIAVPWLTYDHAVSTIAAGDTVYVRASTVTTRSGFSARGVIVPQNPGTSGNSKAIVAYPGESVIIGQDSDNVACTGLCAGIYSSTAFTTDSSYWTFGSIETHGLPAAIGFAGGNHLRFAGMKATCPQADGGGLACAFLSESNNNSSVLGTELYNVGTSIVGGAQKTTHGLYFGTDDFNMEAGWNYIHTLHACRGIQLHSSPTGCAKTGCGDTTGGSLYNLSIHDNWIEDVGCNGVSVGTADPSRGYVKVYNNIFKNVGTGNYNVASGTGDYAAVMVDENNDWLIYSGSVADGSCTSTPCTFSTNKAATPPTVTGVNTKFTALTRGWGLVGVDTTWYIDTCSDDTHCNLFTTPFGSNDSGATMQYRKSGVGNVQVYNNTVYHAGACTGAAAGSTAECGAFSRPRDQTRTGPLLFMELKNNVVYQDGTKPYISNYASWSTYISGDHNDWYNGTGTFPTTSDLTADPLFVSAGTNFNLQSGSTMRGAGANTLSVVPTDVQGLTRPNPPAIGAYEYQAGAGASIVSCTLSPSSATKGVGQTQSFTSQITWSDASVTDGTSTLALVSSAPSVATISAQTATAVGIGTSVITGFQGAVTCSPTSTLTVSASVNASPSGKWTGKLN